MIYTVTLNPAMDYFVSLDTLELGGVNRTKADHKAPGGKGINVSRVLKRMGHKSTALGFIGGFTGEYIKASIEEEQIQASFIQVDGDTRINVKINAREESELNGVSPDVSASDLEKLEAQFSGLVEGDAIVLAGSVPPALRADVYAAWTSQLKKQGVKVYVDTSGTALADVIQAKPTFIKPNQHELSELTGAEISTLKEAVPYVKALIDQGIEYVLVTFAGDGALLATAETILFANTPKGTVKNSVGAGDSTVAGFVCAKEEGKTLIDAFRFAVASGSATAFSTGFAERNTIEALMEEIHVTPFQS
ncbi:1-phosphofructokinase [Bacillus sp. JCM 19041]|uniref:1-phosphofructokinase n=1 Tax=Bacillus sp. JCM 19041 TaxID=1460637 RepID=UPI0006D0044E